jgi:isoquinoline 1-oxidoreductase beta subunit
MLGVLLPQAGARERAALPAHAGSTSWEPSAVLRIGADGRITMTMPYVEMGQGTYTSVPMLIAEELEVELHDIVLEHAGADDKRYMNPALGFQVTGGSTTMRAAWMPMRQAGAAARMLLVQAAAQRWQSGSGRLSGPQRGRHASGKWPQAGLRCAGRCCIGLALAGAAVHHAKAAG